MDAPGVGNKHFFNVLLYETNTSLIPGIPQRWGVTWFSLPQGALCNENPWEVTHHRPIWRRIQYGFETPFSDIESHGLRCLVICIVTLSSDVENGGCVHCDPPLGPLVNRTSNAFDVYTGNQLTCQCDNTNRHWSGAGTTWVAVTRLTDSPPHRAGIQSVFKGSSCIFFHSKINCVNPLVYISSIEVTDDFHLWQMMKPSNMESSLPPGLSVHVGLMLGHWGARAGNSFNCKTYWFPRNITPSMYGNIVCDCPRVICDMVVRVFSVIHPCLLPRVEFTSNQQFYCSVIAYRHVNKSIPKFTTDLDLGLISVHFVSTLKYFQMYTAKTFTDFNQRFRTRFYSSCRNNSGLGVAGWVGRGQHTWVPLRQTPVQLQHHVR